MPIQFSCQCGKQLQVKDELAGRRARCPGCQEVITIPAATQSPAARKPKESLTAGPPSRGRRAAAPPDDRVQREARARRPSRTAPPADIDDDEEEEEPRPRGKKKGKKKSKKKSGANLPLLAGIGGGAAVLLVLIGVLLYFFVFSGGTEPVAKNDNNGGGNNGAINNGGGNNGGINNGGGGNQNVAAEDHLDRIPANADFMATVDLQGLKAKLPPQLVSSIITKGTPNDLEDKLGISVADIARATMFGKADVVAGTENKRPVALITSLKRLDPTKLQEENTLPPDPDGLIRLSKFGKEYLAFLTDYTFAIGTREDLLALKQSSSQPNAVCAKGIALAGKGEHLVVAGQVPEGKIANLLQKLPPDLGQQFAFLSATKEFTLTAKLDGSISVTGGIDFSDPGAASQAKSQLDFWLNVAKNQLNQLPPFQDEVQRQVVGMAGPILNQIQSQANGTRLEVTLTIPKSNVDSAIQLAQAKIAEMPNPEQIMTSNNLKLIGIAMHSHHDAYGSFPQPSFKNGLSWRVKLLPYLEQENLYKQFNLNEPWNSPHNMKLLEQMPKIYERPGANANPGYTHFQVTVGPGGLFPTPNSKVMFQSIRDGTSNTILVAEAKQAVPWTAPQDLSTENLQFGALPTAADFYALFGDGHVQPVPLSTPMPTLRAYVTPNGGEPVTPFP